MVAMNRVRCAWTGWAGQPGLTTFYMASTRFNVQPITSFWTSMAIYIPSGITIVTPALGDVIESTDGSLLGSWTGSNGGSTAASGSNTNWAGSAGVVIDWKTNTIHQNRRIQGRTYIVPAISAVYQSDGTILEATRSSILGNAITLVNQMAQDLLIWSRPYPGRLEQPGPPVKPARPPHDGAAGAVITATVPDIAAVMRSRRA